jgi:hypothetical protein
LDEFCKVVQNFRTRFDKFGEAVPLPLTDNDWKDRLSKFFNAKTGPIRPGRRRFGSFVAASEHPTFEHPTKIYAEYEAIDENAIKNLSTVRLWDFTKADGKFQTEEGRLEVAGRERDVVAYLKDRSDAFDGSLLTPLVEDPDQGVSY